MTPFDDKCQSLQMFHTFCAIANRFRDIIIIIFNGNKVEQGHGGQFSRLGHSMVNVNNLQVSPAFFCARDITILLFYIKIGQYYGIQLSQYAIR